jgi:4-amino-4-deoxy-L-arabinose transferase-like glycosyltransferase
MLQAAEVEHEQRSDELAPIAWRPLLAVAAGAVSLLLAVANRYGWHRDELYFVEAGRHLAWGYVDQPPFTPFVARVADILAPGNLVALRALPALSTGAVVIVAALLARELGGGRRAQLLAAGAMVGGYAIGVGHLLATDTFDLLGSLVLLLLVTRLLRTSDTRWWLAIGAVVGLSALNKDIGPLYALALGFGVVVERRWEVLRTRWLPLAVVIALVLAAPNLVWQLANGWPQLDMARALERRIGNENRVELLPLQIVIVGPLVSWVLVRGVRRLRAATWARPLLWAWPAALVVVLVTGGRFYYAAPLSIVVMVAGMVESERLARTRAVSWCVIGAVITAIPTGLPALPESTVAGTPIASVNIAIGETIGWPELANEVAAVVRGLPQQDQAHLVLLTLTYGEAGALDRFGPALGLPPAYSGHNSYADFRQPSDPDAVVVAVRFAPDDLTRYFTTCDQVAKIDNGVDVDNEAQGQPIVVCRGLREDWPTIWRSLRKLS